MAGEIRITAVRRDEPDIGLYVLALIALARQLAADETSKRAVAVPVADTASGEVRHD